MKKILSACLFIFFVTGLFAQSKLEQILKSSRNYKTIVKEAERYLREEKREREREKLRRKIQGEENEDDYVKFMRWQHFWKKSLNADGTLGDITAYWKNEAKKGMQAKPATSPYANVKWTNISNQNYIISQIGLGRTTSVAFHPTDPNTFYVGTAIGGVWKTSDGGATYTPLGDELPFMAVNSIIVNKTSPNVLYAAVSPPSIGVYKSINSGDSWQPTALTFNFDDGVSIFWLEADPNDANKMFVATSTGLYKTTDGFLSVTKVNSTNTFDVKVNKGNSSIVYQGGNDGKFYRSTNGGSTFSQIKNFGGGSVYSAVTALNTSKVYVRNDSTLYKSTDNGASFSATTNILPVHNGVLAFSPSNQNILLTGNFETQESDNDGASFYATSQWLGDNGLPLIHVDQRNIFTNPLQPDFVYYCNDGGLYRYVISTKQFVNLCNGLLITQFYDIAVAQTDANVIGGGSQDNGSMYRDSAGTWRQYAPTGDGMTEDIDPTNANIRYWTYQYGAMHRFINGTDASIQPVTYKGAWETPFRIDHSNPNRLIAGYSEIYESLNQGTSWTNISGSQINVGNMDEVAIARSNPKRLYAVAGNQLFRKSVLGNTWTAKTLPVSSASDLEVDPFNMDVIYISTPGFVAGSKVYRSVDSGNTWTNISGSLPNVSTACIEPLRTMPRGLFVGTDAGVYYIDSTLTDWQLYGKLPHTRVEDVEIQYSAKLVRVGTHGRGVLEAPLIIEKCGYGAPDADNDGVCNLADQCPNLNNALLGTACNDGDSYTSGETWIDCECKGGQSNIAYCAAAGSAGTGGDWINKVRLNTLVNSSAQSGYSNFKNMSTVLGLGSTYTLEVYMNGVFAADKVYAWIDYNRNGVFDASELITMSAPDVNNNNKSTGTVNVPTGIGTNATTMRVRCIYATPNNADPCNNYFGEVEDYTVSFSKCSASGNLGTGSDWIKKVSLNTISNTSVQTYYGDYTQLSTDIARGDSFPIQVTMNYSFALDHVYVWLDYNHNSIFEASEKVTMTKPADGYDAVYSGMVKVSSTALSGETIMRVRCEYGDNNDAQPCGSAYAGEVEDYTINITYCTATGAAGTGSDYITRVKLSTIDNSSVQTSYSNFKNISTDLIRGASYPIEVKLFGAFAADSVYVWIDYDGDGQFETTEQTIMSKLTPGFNAIATGNVVVPESAIQGKTTMRVRVIYASPNTAQPCGDYFGEVEDYSVNLTYCGAVGAGGTGSDWVKQVTVNQIDNVSSQTGYSNFKNISTPVYLNNDYELKVNINFAFDLDSVYAWLDLNHDGSFTTTERIIMSNLTANSNSTSTGIMHIPTGTVLGATTLRTRVIYANPNPPDPCHAYFGEVEDYTVVLTDNLGGGSCTAQVVLGGEYGSLSSGIYKAGSTILSTSKIANGANVQMKAGSSVTWNPGFSSQPGAVVTATIVACN